jgi:hypothetical protein
MNHAICLQCGTAKAGALAACPRCGFRPEKTEDRAKSVLLSDRCAPMPSLEKAGKKIAQGQKLQFDDADVLKWSDLLDSIPRSAKKHMGLTVRQWTIYGIAVGVAVASGFCALSWMELR